MNESFEAKEDELEISSPSRRTKNTKLYGNRRLGGSRSHIEGERGYLLTGNILQRQDL